MKNWGQLLESVEWSREKLAKTKATRLTAIKEYVGNHYGECPSKKVVPVNFIELAVLIFMQQLVSSDPKCKITAKSSALKPMAYTTQIAINEIAEELHLATTIRRAVLDALFSFGVVKLGLCESDSELQGFDVGEVFVANVDVDDYVCDMTAKSRDMMSYEGNDYDLSYDEAKAFFGKDVGESDANFERSSTDENGDLLADSVTSADTKPTYEKRVRLRDLWLAKENKLITYSVEKRTILREVEWDGPDGGPYRILGFADVPSNVLPLPPVAMWLDLHELGNMLFRKIARQADNKKTIGLFGGGDDDAVAALRRAEDGDGIKYSGPKPESLAVGGVDPQLLAFFLQVHDLFNYFGGNLDSLGGLSPTAQTVGQEEFVQAGSGARIAHMADRMNSFVESVFGAMAWYLWTDPVRTQTVHKPLVGTDINIPVVWSPETRDADWLEFNLSIDAFSMRRETPEMKLRKIGEVMNTYVLPFLPQIVQQGGQVNFRELFSKIGEFANLPELAELIQFAGEAGTVRQALAQEHDVPKPANTTRTYERINRPGASRSGKADVMSRILMGAGAQKSEVDSLSRRNA